MTEKKNDKNMKRLIGKDVVTLASKIPQSLLLSGMWYIRR
jgi:hypothetical protein